MRKIGLIFILFSTMVLAQVAVPPAPGTPVTDVPATDNSTSSNPPATSAPAASTSVSTAPASTTPVAPATVATTPVTTAPAATPGTGAPAANKKKTGLMAPKPPSALDKYIEAASQPDTGSEQVSAGSLWTSSARYSDLASDLRSRHVDDIVTILVQESASAVSSGDVKTARQSSTQNSITALAGITKSTGPWANLLNLSGQTQLTGTGTTSRTTTLTTTVSARVTHVLRNGNLVVEGTKIVGINSENETITVRGVIRPIDLDTTNSILSARIAQMEIQVNGKGVVADAIHRPNILYRMLLGILPF